MSTGENEQGLRSVTDLTRFVSIAILILHFYTMCHATFAVWRLTITFADKIIVNLMRLPFLRNTWNTKLSILVLLVVFLFGCKGKKNEKYPFTRH